MKLNLKWITDTIGEEYKKWKQGDIVKIQAQTGTGKTFFIKSVLIPYLNDYETMLIVANRINLKRQLKKDLFNYYNMPMPKTLKELDEVITIGNVTIMSYQSLSEKINADNYNLHKHKLNLEDYKYIICDECHFFLSDGAFNNKCYLSWKELVKGRHKQAIKIFISATMHEIESSIDISVNKIQNNGIGTYCKCKLYSYTSGIDYSYLNINYFKSVKDITLTIKNDKSSDKWLVFVTKKDDGKHIKETLEGYKKVDIITKDTDINKSSDLQEIINNSKFKSDVLVCTKAMDNGINIEDLEVKNIVIMAWDKISFIQELGRVRVDIDNASMIKLYINTRSYSSFNTLINKTYEPKKALRDAFREDENKFNAKYNYNYSVLPTDIFILNTDNKWIINLLGSARLDKDNHFAEVMCNKFYDEKHKENRTFAYIKEQLSWIVQEDKFNELNLIENVIDDEEIKRLEEWIEEHLGVELYSEQQQELSSLIINELTTIPNDVDYRTEKLKPSTLESVLRVQLELPYAINKPKKKRSGENKNRNYITIIKC